MTYPNIHVLGKQLNKEENNHMNTKHFPLDMNIINLTTFGSGSIYTATQDTIQIPKFLTKSSSKS